MSVVIQRALENLFEKYKDDKKLAAVMIPYLFANGYGIRKIGYERQVKAEQFKKYGRTIHKHAKPKF
jgi:hypothetical protein